MAPPSQTLPHLGNHLLNAMARESTALPAYLDQVDLTQAQLLHAAGQDIGHVYFPVSSIVALECPLEDGSSAEFALTGREGIVGISCFTGRAATTYSATVLCEGSAWRAPARVMKALFEDNGRLRRLVLHYMQALMTDAAQKVVCIRRHSIEQQLCRTLLACLDRRDQAQLVLTQELIARTMGVRREAVTLAAQKLQAAGLIAYARGHITVLRRAGIEALSCECYRIVSQAFSRLSVQS
jgi:CRP-like cAMP-binding protein